MVSQLHGFNAHKKGGVSSLSLFGSANNGTTGGIVLPASIIAGDVIVFFDGADGSALVADTYPSGFTAAVPTMYDGSPNFTRRSISYKLAVGGEGGTTIDGFDATTDRHVAMVFRGNIPITSVVVGSPASEMSGSSVPAQQDCLASAGSAPLVVFGFYAASAAISTRGFNPAEDAEITPATTFYTKYKIYNSSPVDTNVTQPGAPAGVGLCLASFYLECS